MIVGETEALAQEKRAVIEATAREVDALVLISEVLNYDFGSRPIDEPFTDEELSRLAHVGRSVALSSDGTPGMGKG